MSEPEFLHWAIVLSLHRRSLERFGGLDGIRDQSALESALMAGENTYFYGGGDFTTWRLRTRFTWPKARDFWMETNARPPLVRRLS